MGPAFSGVPWPRARALRHTASAGAARTTPLIHLRQTHSHPTAPTTTRTPKPLPLKRDSQGSTSHSLHATAATLLAVSGLAGVGYYVALCRPEWLHEARQQSAFLLGALLEPDPELVTGCLPPRSSTAAAACPATVIVALEGTVLSSDFERTSGQRLAVRPGLRELLLHMGSRGYEVVLWAPGVDAAVAGSCLDRLVEDLTRGSDRHRWLAFCAHVDREASHTKAKEIALALKEHRPPRVSMIREVYLEHEKKALYAEKVLKVVATLGRQHEIAAVAPSDGLPGAAEAPRVPGTATSSVVASAESVPAGATKLDSSRKLVSVLPLELLPRDRHSILVIDSDADRARIYAENTLLVSPFRGQRVEEAAAAGREESGGDDPTLGFVLKLLGFYETAVELSPQSPAAAATTAAAATEAAAATTAAAATGAAAATTATADAGAGGGLGRTSLRTQQPTSDQDRLHPIDAPPRLPASPSAAVFETQEVQRRRAGMGDNNNDSIGRGVGGGDSRWKRVAGSSGAGGEGAGARPDIVSFLRYLRTRSDDLGLRPHAGPRTHEPKDDTVGLFALLQRMMVGQVAPGAGSHRTDALLP